MAAQRRNRRGGVESRWHKTETVIGPDGSRTKVQVPSARYGIGKRWLARYVDDHGEEHTKSFDRKIDGQQWLDAQMSTLVQGTHVAPSAGRELIRHTGKRWLEAQGHLKDTTGSTRRYTWNTHVEPKWGETAVRDVHKGDIRTWIAEMVTAGVGVPTIENAVGVLRMILEWAVDEQQIPRNPCTGVRLPRRRHNPRGYLTHAQVEQLALEVTENSTVVRFLAYTGLRWGEMAALKVSSFDMHRRRVNVLEAVAEVEGRLVWSTTKGHERRSVPFPSFLAPELSALIRPKAKDSLVFQSAEGATLRVSTYRPRVFKPAVERLRKNVQEARDKEFATTGGVRTPIFPIITPHDLRHTAASLAISAGANVKAVQTMLGHKSAALTLDTYADLFPDDLEAVADALDVAARAARSALG